MSEYFTDLDRIRAAGLEYATNGIAAGDTMPDDAPFSGEWADGLTGQDVLDSAGIGATFADLEDFEQVDILDAWEAGYLSAAWPEVAHVGHRAHLTGAWFCDTCNSPYCDNA